MAMGQAGHRLFYGLIRGRVNRAWFATLPPVTRLYSGRCWKKRSFVPVASHPTERHRAFAGPGIPRRASSLTYLLRLCDPGQGSASPADTHWVEIVRLLEDRTRQGDALLRVAN